MAKSVKLEIFREKLLEKLNESYPDYKIDQYFNGCGSISWLSVIEYPADLKIAEVIVVERFGSGDTPSDSLLVIDYVNSDSRRFKNPDEALYFMNSILTIASDRKKANEKGTSNEKQGEEENTVHLESLHSDVIKTGVLVTTRGNGKTLFLQNLIKNLFGFKIKDVLFNDPATVVFWEDGEKTVVQCQNGEPFDPEKGLAMAITKRLYGNKYAYYDVFKKWVGKYNKKKFRELKQVQMKEETENPSVPDENPKEETEVTNNGIIGIYDETGTALKPFCDIKIDNSEKPEENGNADK